MSITAQNRNLVDWFARIRTHQTVLPRFQRFESWDHQTIAQMFNTILRGLPVGATLILQVGDEQPFHFRPIHGAPETGERVTEHLLDGQQRLTGLWRALHNNYEDRTYFLHMNLEDDIDDDTDMPYFVDSIARWRKNDKIYPLWVDKPRDQWEHRIIPLDLCNPADQRRSENLRHWTRAAIEKVEDQDSITDEITKIWQRFATFNLPYLSLPVNTPKDTALDVFIKMNTTAVSLSTYDIVVAQVEAGMGISLHDLVAEAKAECSNISAYYDLENLTLYASALLQSSAPTYSTYTRTDFSNQLIENWNKLLEGMNRTVEFLQAEKLFDSARLPTDVVVPVLVALWAIAPNKPDKQGRARLILTSYCWRAFFSNRYEKSTSTRALEDFNQLRQYINDQTHEVPKVFDEKEHPLPGTDELALAGWPKRKDRLARAILALALRNGGQDLADGSDVSRSNLARREYHHLFPIAHLKDQGYQDDEIHRVINCALVTWQTNRTISGKPPETYLTERCDGTGSNKEVGTEIIKSRLESHLIPYQCMVENDYRAFIETRAKMVESEMNKLCSSKFISN